MGKTITRFLCFLDYQMKVFNVPYTLLHFLDKQIEANIIIIYERERERDIEERETYEHLQQPIGLEGRIWEHSN